MMPKSRFSVFLSVLFVFASGAAMGAVSYRLYVVKTIITPVKAASKKNPEEYRKLVVSRLKDAVHLDGEQLTQVQRIYDEEGVWFAQTHKDFDAQIQQIYHQFANERDIRHEASIAKITKLLRADQEPLYEKWLAERAANHKRHLEQEQRREQTSAPPLRLP
jgi:hypothetical protein